MEKSNSITMTYYDLPGSNSGVVYSNIPYKEALKTARNCIISDII